MRDLADAGMTMIVVSHENERTRQFLSKIL